MTTPNSDPIFSRVADIQGNGTILTLAANDYTGLSPNNQEVFTADATNGGFIQRLRFKPLGTNASALSARIFLNPGKANAQSGTTGYGHLASVLGTPATPTGTPSTTGGALPTLATYFAQIVAVDASGALTALGASSAAVSVTGPTGSIAWAWTATANAVGYRIYLAQATTAFAGYVYVTTNSYTQIALQEAATGFTPGTPVTMNNLFYGEIGLPATTLATTPLLEVDYPMNFAMPPGWQIYVGLSVAAAAGWQVTAIAGKY